MRANAQWALNGTKPVWEQDALSNLLLKLAAACTMLTPSYITEYIETNDMSYKSKMKDLDILIEYFEQQERYEECSLLVKVKQKVEKRELLIKIQGNDK